MKRRTRWLVLGLLAAIVVVVMAVAVSSASGLVRALAINRIQATTGRAAAIDALALDLRRGLLSVRGFRLTDHDGDTLATIGQLDARIRLRSLLRGHLWIRDLTIKDSTVRVVRLDAHQFNISDLIQRKGGGGGRMLDVTVDRFELTQGTVLLEDRSLDPDRVWKSENIHLAARRVSTRRDDGEAEGSSTINGSPISLRMEQLRLHPVHFRAEVKVQQADLTVARLYLPADAPVVLDRGRLDTTVTVAMDARTGLHVDVEGQAADIVLIRRNQRDPFLTAPAVRVAVRDFTVGNNGSLAVARLEVSGATTLVNGDASPPARFELPRVMVRADGLAWPVQGPARVELTSSVPGGGELSVSGQVRAQPAAADVMVRLTRVNLAPWGRYAAPWLRVTGTGEATLAIQAELGSEIAATGRGSARAIGVVVADADRRLLTLDEAEVSGLALNWPSRLTISRVRLRRPSAVVERDASGVIGLPGLTPKAGASEGAAVGDSTPAPNGTPARLTLAVNEVGIEDGAVTWRDLGVKPATTVRLASVRFLAKEATWPVAGPLPVQLRAATPDGGTVEVNGQVGIQPLTADVQVKARSVALAPYAPYLPLGRPVRGYADANLTATMSRDPELQARVRGTAGLSRMSVADGQRRVLSAERVEARGLDVDWPGRIDVERLVLRQPWVLVERDRQGGFPLRTMLMPPAPEPAANASAAAPGRGSQRTITVGELTIQDGGARVVDHAVSSPYAEDVSRLSLRARGLATASEKPAQVDLRATIGPAGVFLVRGTVGALDGPLSLDLAGEMRDVDMVRLNPYLKSFAGWNARQGRLSTKISCRVNSGDLESRNEIQLGRLEVVRAAPDDAARQRIGLPLGLIVALMKNNRGEIRLALPIGGRLNDPHFEFREAIWSALRSVAVHAIALPVSWVGRLRFSHDSKIEDVEIDPLDFETGTATLAAQAAPRLERLTTFMRTLPDVRMIITPVVSLGDIEALKTRALTARIKKLAGERKVPELEAARQLFAQQLPGPKPPDTLDEIVAALREVEEPPADEAGALAKDRAQAVRDALKKAGIDAERLAVNKDPGALETLEAGRVEFGLTDQLKPRRTLADLLRGLVEALQRKLTAARARG